MWHSGYIYMGTYICKPSPTCFARYWDCYWQIKASSWPRRTPCWVTSGGVSHSREKTPLENDRLYEECASTKAEIELKWQK